jgi:hypothetical protein
MPLFGSARDISLFRHLNRELINNLIDTTVDILKSSILEMNENLYGEVLGKSYWQSVRVGALIEKESKQFEQTEYGTDVQQSCNFKFLRDDLVDIPNLKLEVGDVLKWNNIYWEIDTVNMEDYYAGQNPNYSHAGDQHGWSQTIECGTHMTRRRKIDKDVSKDHGYDKGIY